MYERFVYPERSFVLKIIFVIEFVKLFSYYLASPVKKQNIYEKQKLPKNPFV